MRPCSIPLRRGVSMDPDLATRIYLALSSARTALGRALALTIPRDDAQEAGYRIYEATARIEEVMDECVRIVPSLRNLPHDNWPEREDPP